ncbi:hypothetical protein ACTL6U_11545 [Rhodovibrionaceae bacterium A322]
MKCRDFHFFAFLAPLVLVFGPMAAALAQDSTPEVVEQSVLDLTLQSRIDPEIDHITKMTLLRAGKPLQEMNYDGHRRVLEEPENLFPLPPGEDITGDGIPNLVIQAYSGGAHCCYQTWIFSVEPDRLVLLANIDSSNSALQFNKLEDDEGYSITVIDWTFAYWRTDYVHSARPEVRLTYQYDSFQPDPGLMKQPAPGDAQLTELAEKLKALDWKEGVPEELTEAMTRLIYGGNGELALTLFERSWPADKPGRDFYLMDFGMQLGNSPYWPGLALLNGWE